MAPFAAYVSPRLPPEIIFRVVGKLDPEKDARTLSACALVCRLLLFEVRASRFASLMLNPRRAAAFQRLDNISALASNVRHLHLVDSFSWTNIWREWMPEPLSTLLKGFKTVDVQSLRLDAFGICTRMLDILWENFPGLKELRTESCKFTHHAFFTIHVGFRCLEVITMNNGRVEFAADMHELYNTPIEAPLSTLNFLSRWPSEPFATDIAQRLWSSKPYRQLQHLHITRMHYHELRVLLDFLNEAGSNLKSLAVGFLSSYEGVPRVVSTLLALRTLRKCTQLNKFSILSLHLGLIRLPGLKRTDRSHLTWVPEILDEIALPNIECVELQIRAPVSSDDDAAQLDWGSVAKLLADSSRFPSLREVKFQIDGTADQMHIVEDCIK